MRTGKGRPLTTLSVSQTLTKVERINPNISGKEQPGRSWSRAKRETTGQHSGRSHGSNAKRRESLRDRCRGRTFSRDRVTGGLALRARPPATVRVPIRGRDSRYVRGSAS